MISPDQTATATCPAGSPRKLTPPTAEPATPRVGRSAAGVWQIRGFAETRAILRAQTTRQAGFGAERIFQASGLIRPPILYQEGPEHHAQRRQTARFFTPRAVDEQYRGLMQLLADRAVGELLQRGDADLSMLARSMAVGVVSQVVGLTDSALPGLAERILALFHIDAPLRGPLAGLRARADDLQSQARTLAFMLLDVMPAIRARQRQPREDLISHLLGTGARPADILVECITYAAAGMVTTREFICIAAWHLIEHDALRRRFLAAPEDERHAILEEILRVEPVVGHLYRRTLAPLTIDQGGAPLIIPAGALIDIQLRPTNADPRVVDADGDQVCPGRPLRAERVTPALASFGDGHHRCPGAFIAIQESDIFLRRLLAIEGLRISRQPDVSWNELVAGYEQRNFMIAVRDPA